MQFDPVAKRGGEPCAGVVLGDGASIVEVVLARRARRRSGAKVTVACGGNGVVVRERERGECVRGGRTLVAASTLDPDLRDESAKGGKIDSATVVGTSIAQKAKDAGVERVVFDRGGYAYHGRVKALAEAAREVGLEF